MAECQDTKSSLIKSHDCNLEVALVGSCRPSDPNDLVQLATQIQKAGEITSSVSYAKLKVVAEQVRFFEEQARKVLREVQLNADLHRVPCNFVPAPCITSIGEKTAPTSSPCSRHGNGVPAALTSFSEPTNWRATCRGQPRTSSRSAKQS